MKKKIFLTMVMASFFFNGCTIMKNTSLIQKPNKKKVIVNFVRPSVFFADGVDVNIWNGEEYLGALSSGSIIQIEVNPGKHLFMSQSNNWSYAFGNLVAGKQYFIKANPLPFGIFILGVAKSDDKRVDEWLDRLTPTIIALEKDKKQVETEQKENIRQAISDFEKGEVTRFATMNSKSEHPNISRIKHKKK